MKRAVLSVGFDTLGILNLIAASGAMMLFTWAADGRIQTLALRGFTASFLMMLVFFALGRLVEFFDLMRPGSRIERRDRRTADREVPQPATAENTEKPALPVRLQLVEPSPAPDGTAKRHQDAA